MSLSALERETVVTTNDAEGWAEVWSAQRPVITRLRKNPAATLVEEGSFEGSAWARFTIPAGLVSFRSKRREQTLSDDERAERAERFREALRRHP